MRVSVLLSAFLAVALSSPAFAADKEFDAFWTKFKAALQKNDKAAVTSMTKLPYMLDSHLLTREQFMRKYNEFFPAPVRKTLLKAKPVKDRDSWFVFAGEEIFIFAKSDGKYMFTEIGVND